MTLRQVFDLGTIYNKTGAGGLGTSPTFSSTVIADRAAKIRIEVVATLAGGSTAGNITVKAQVSRDGTNFTAIPITDESAGTTAATGTVTTTAGQTKRNIFGFDPADWKGGVQVSINTAGAANAADVVTVTAEAN